MVLNKETDRFRHCTAFKHFENVSMAMPSAENHFILLATNRNIGQTSAGKMLEQHKNITSSFIRSAL
jgi:hypothetical protein